MENGLNMLTERSRDVSLERPLSTEEHELVAVRDDNRAGQNKSLKNEDELGEQRSK